MPNYKILMKQLLLNFINKGSERSIKAKKNVLSMLFIKGGSILVGLLLVPLTLEYVDSESYGIWLTLSSMVAWISFLAEVGRFINIAQVTENGVRLQPLFV